MRKIYVFLMVFSIAVSLAGCDSLQKKFTRKKKDVKPIQRIYQLKKYDVKPSTELYKKHYAYWQSWMSELIQYLGENHKKDVRCVDEALSQLNDMRNILIRDKADELSKHIRRLEEAREIIVKEELSQYNKNQVMMTLEREDRMVKSEFTAARVKDCIKESFDETP